MVACALTQDLHSGGGNWPDSTCFASAEWAHIFPSFTVPILREQ
jgi:hypothetical protein